MSEDLGCECYPEIGAANTIVQPSTPDVECPTLRLGSVALLAGIVITIISTLFHASSEDLTNHPIVFAVYGEI